MTVLLVENDSTDNTRQLLLDWAAEAGSRVFILGCGVNAPVCTLNAPATVGHPVSSARIRKMATLRNLILDFLAAEKTKIEYDYLFVWDCDIIGRLYADGVAHTMGVFHSRADVDGMCALGLSWWPFGLRRSGWLYGA